jgi:predicted Zn-dependent protease
MQNIQASLLLTTLAATLLGACAAPQNAGVQAPFVEERVHPQARVKMIIPRGWTVQEQADGALALADSSAGINIDVKVVDGADLGTALLTVATGILLGYDNLGLDGAPVDNTINGMPALFQDGHATVQGHPVSLSVGVIDTPADKFLLIVGEGDPAALQAHENEVRTFINSIVPM